MSVTSQPDDPRAISPAEYLGAIIESSQDAIISKNLKGIVTSWNPAAEQIFGYTAEEMVGRPVAVLAAPQVANEMPQILARIARGERVDHYETMRRRKDGQIIHVSLTISPVRNAAGEIIGASKIARDISDRRRYEAERSELLARERAGREAAEHSMLLHQEAERNLALLVEASDSILASLKLDDVLPRTLELAKRFFAADAYAVWRVRAGTESWRIAAASGLSDSFVQVGITGPVSSLPHPLAVRNVEEESPPDRRADLRKEGIQSYLATPMRVGGTTLGTLTFYFRSNREFSETDCRMAATLANLTASAIAAAESYEEQRQLRADAEIQARISQLLAHMSVLLGSTLDYGATLKRVANLAVPDFAEWCSVHLVTGKGEIQHVAVHHADPRKAELARRLLERYPPSLDNPHGIGGVLRSGRSEIHHQVPWDELDRATRKDPHFRLLRRMHLGSVILAPMIARERNLGVITFCISSPDRQYTPADLAIAEQLAASAALAIDNAALFAEAERERSEAQASAEALRQSNEELERFAYVASHDLKEALRTVTSYAQLLSKRYRGQLDPDADEFIGYLVESSLWMNTLLDAVLRYSRLTRGGQDLRGPVDSEAALAAALANLRGAIKESGVIVTHDPLPVVMADHIQMVQVFQNLLSNSIQYRNGANPRVHVSAVLEENRWRVSVSDNGIGIPEEYWTRVFELFRRLHSRPVSGAGIGLAICKRIVEQHDGRIWLDSEPDKGTTVHFTMAPV